MNYLEPRRLDALAREYALGTLSGRARRRFERVLRDSVAAERAVLDWQGRLATLAAPVPPLAPRAAVWSGLEQRLFGPPPKPQTRRGWLAALSGTLAGTFAGGLLAVLVLRRDPGLAGLEEKQDALPQSYVGLLLDAQGKPTVLASSRRHGKLLTVKILQPITVPEGRVAQLWAVDSGGVAIFPVGVVPASGSGTLTLADTSEKLFFRVPRLAVSFEPEPARAGAQPKGDFVLSGHCVKLW